MGLYSDQTLFTTDDLKAALKEGAINLLKGVQSLTFQGQQINYRSMRDMKEVLKMVQDELIDRGAIEDDGFNKVKQIQIQTRDSGFGNG